MPWPTCIQLCICGLPWSCSGCENESRDAAHTHHLCLAEYLFIQHKSLPLFRIATEAAAAHRPSVIEIVVELFLNNNNYACSDKWFRIEKGTRTVFRFFFRCWMLLRIVRVTSAAAPLFFAPHCNIIYFNFTAKKAEIPGIWFMPNNWMNIEHLPAIMLIILVFSMLKKKNNICMNSIELCSSCWNVGNFFWPIYYETAHWRPQITSAYGAHTQFTSNKWPVGQRLSVHVYRLLNISHDASQNDNQFCGHLCEHSASTEPPNESPDS